MISTNHTSTYDFRIQKDKMNLTVTNRHPVFQKKSEQEVRQTISAGLYRIFKKYE